MDNKLLFKNKYDNLSIDEKKEILNQIATHYGFTILEYSFYEYGDKSLFTAVFSDNIREFVFIPGVKGLTLGWKKTNASKKEDKELIEYIKTHMFYFLLLSLEENHPLAKYTVYSTLDDAKKNISEKEFAELDNMLTRLTLSHIDNITSFIRKVDIMPMLMERRSESLNWQFVKNIMPADVADSPTYFKIYQDIVKSGKDFIIKKTNLKAGGKKIQKYVIDDKGLLVYKYKEINYEEILFHYTSSGYNIPTLNQWEYAASCGNPTLFTNNNILYNGISKNKPNGFGLYICSNIYEPEIISDDKYIYKGGDGGYYDLVNGHQLANLSLSPFHNTKSANFNYIEESGLFTRRVILVNLNKKYRPKINKKNINKFIQDNYTEENYDSIIYAVNSVNYEGLSFENAIKIIEIYHQKGFINKSLELIERFEDEGKNNPEFLYLSGYTYFRLSNSNKASAVLKKAVEIKRNMPECYQLLSYIYHRASLINEMKSTFHSLFKLAPDIAKNMVPILFPKGLTYEDMDYDDLWTAFILSIAKDNENKTVFNIADSSLISEIILLDSTVKLILNTDITSYIKNIRHNGSKYLFKIFEKIETSKYVKDNNNYLLDKDMEMALDEFQACKNILFEAETVDLKEVDEDYLQNLTNSFFDNSSALTALAYIHYSNCRMFEAGKLFDTEYPLCSLLYQTKQIPVEIADGIRVLLEEFINNITINLYTYGDIQLFIENIIEKSIEIKNKYSEKYPAYMYLIEKNLYKDLTYILKWFNIDIDVKDTTQKLK